MGRVFNFQEIDTDAEAMNRKENDLSGFDRTLCPHCLGRLFGKLGHGMTNPERTRAMTALLGTIAVSEEMASFTDTLSKTISVLPDRDEWSITAGDNCFICEGLFQEIDNLATLVRKALDPYEFDNFQIGVRVDPEITQKEEAIWGEINATFQEPIKAELNREIGKLVARGNGKEVEFGSPQVVAVVDTAFDHVDVQVAPVFLYGRYRKNVRGIPQTKWPCRKCRGRGCAACDNTGKQYRETVEEFISVHAIELLKGESAKFHGMGREDIDARMLGRGRPFVLEITRPHRRDLNLSELENRVNSSADGKIEITGLKWTERRTVAAVKEARFSKVYSARISFSRAVDGDELERAVKSLSGKTIAQRTPKRVSHRRADLVRERVVSEATLEEFDREKGLWCVVTVKGESGLYIKELLHSDEGRTEPSLQNELSELEPVVVTVEKLDVLEVCDQGSEIA